MGKNNIERRISKRILKINKEKKEKKEKDRINGIKNRIKKNFEIYHSEYPWHLSTKERKQMLYDMGIEENTEYFEYNSRNPFNFKNKNYSKEYTYIPGRTITLEELYLYNKLNYLF